jgi:hypothetical protein
MKLGLQYPVCAPLTETVAANGTVTVTVGTGMVMGKLMAQSTSLNLAEANGYADDGLDESVREFVSGTISETINDLIAAVETAITGATAATGTGTEGLVNGSEDTAPWMRHGLIEVHLIGGVKKYKTKVYYRVKFAAPDDDNSTKGESASLSGVSLSGVLSRDQATGNWRDIRWHDTLAAAKTYINGLCGISTGTGTT